MRKCDCEACQHYQEHAPSIGILTVLKLKGEYPYDGPRPNPKPAVVAQLLREHGYGHSAREAEYCMRVAEDNARRAKHLVIEAAERVASLCGMVSEKQMKKVFLETFKRLESSR